MAVNKKDDVSKKVYEDIDSFVDYYEKEMNRTNKYIEKQMEIAEKRLASEKLSLAMYYENQLNEYRKKGWLNTQEEVLKYARTLQTENNIRNRKEQLDLIKELSKRNQKELKNEEAYLTKLVSLRSSTKADGTEKTASEKRTDTIKADLLEFGNTLKTGLDKSLTNLGANFMNAVNQMSNVINSTITTYANYRGTINARLQGSTYDRNNKAFQNLSDTLDKVAFSGLISASDLYANLDALVKEGIGTNLEQKALFQTIKDYIAGTFDVNSASLKRIIRIQQEDSTAARLGMESYLTKFLNEFTKSTEYLTTTFDTVADSLLEASAMLKNASSSTEFEYVVQKWLGSLTGLGLSESTASSIAQALGYLGSGNIENLSGSAINNLLVMAASRANISYADLLTKGLDALDANSLLLGMTQYLQELGASTNNVVKSQLAKTFGVSVSDLVAVQNLGDMTNLYKNVMSSEAMYKELTSQFGSLTTRLGGAKILENLFSNFQYSTGMNIANNPVLYSLWKITDMIQGVTGGINIPAISVMGNMVDLNTTVENLMKLGIVGMSTLGGIGDIISGFGSTFNGKNLLSALEISSGISAITKGSGLLSPSNELQKVTTSVASYIGNTAGEVYSENAISTATQEAETKTQEVEKHSDIYEYYEQMKLDEVVNSIDTNIKKIVDDGIYVTLRTSTVNGLTI